MRRISGYREAGLIAGASVLCCSPSVDIRYFRYLMFLATPDLSTQKLARWTWEFGVQPPVTAD